MRNLLSSHIKYQKECLSSGKNDPPGRQRLSLSYLVPGDDKNLKSRGPGQCTSASARASAGEHWRYYESQGGYEMDVVIAWTLGSGKLGWFLWMLGDEGVMEYAMQGWEEREEEVETEGLNGPMDRAL